MSKVLIAGALGVVGRGAWLHFEAKDDWEIVPLTRRTPDFESRAKALSVDLRNADAFGPHEESLRGVTHVVYAALHEQTSLVAGWTDADHIRTNLGMLATLITAVENAGAPLQHITLLQGGKAYGVHLGPPAMIPSRETDPRTMPPNFYYDQEDFIRERQKTSSWTWTIFRPPSVCGFALRSPMNAVLVASTYAAISRELGLPLRFPGALGHLKDTCDAGLLARAIEWAGSSKSAQNEVFNISNGDCFLWEQLFPAIAGVFGMPCGIPHPMSLGRVMADKADVWARIAERHDLRFAELAELVPSFEFGDWTFRHGQAPFHSLLSTVKLRRAGFSDVVDTEYMLIDQLKQLQAKRILPR